MTGPDAKKSPTLRDVARAAGVSRTTVSNAFNRPDQLSGAARDRILDIARGLGYHGPNPMARKLRTGRIGAIGVVFGDTLPYAFSDHAAILFLHGVGRACEAAGCSLLIIPTTDQGAAQTTVREALVDGFIVYTTPSEDVVSQVFDRNLPVVTVDRSGVPGVTAVRVDDRAGARSIAEHVIDHGHRRLAIIVPRLSAMGEHSGFVDRARRAAISYAVCADRIGGYLDAAAAAGLDPLTIPIDERPDNHEDAGRAAALNLLSLDPQPTAILAMTDRMALGALRAAREMGLRVPEDVSIAGFDDLPAAAEAAPPLTTVRQPLVEKGEQAAELLFGTRRHTGLHIIETELVVRRSTSPLSAQQSAMPLAGD